VLNFIKDRHLARLTAYSLTDQALLSLTGFATSALLLRLASKESFGLYAQMVNLLAFFSPVHAGIFVSAFIALASQLRGPELVRFKAGMARAELTCLVVSLPAVGFLMLLLPRSMVGTGSTAIVLPFCVSLGGLWAREFVRAQYFVRYRHNLALLVDSAYSAMLIGGIVLLSLGHAVTVNLVLLVGGFASLLAVAGPWISGLIAEAPSPAIIRRDLTTTWVAGRWDIAGSAVSWLSQQSYIYFAALQGGLAGAAEIAAARLLVMPLLVVWTGYANVIRPESARLFAAGDLRGLRGLAARASALVIALTCGYGVLLFGVYTTLQGALMGRAFEGIGGFVALWLLYALVTGLDTVLAGILRSGLQFKSVFLITLLVCPVTLAAVAIGLLLGSKGAPLWGMTLGEGVFILLASRRLLSLLQPGSAQAA